VKLAKRISLFFLAALAVVLVGFSGSIYYFAHSHLMRQLDAVTEAALDTLNAAIETGPQGLEWEISDRKLAIDHPDGGSLEWAVFDGTGQRLDGAQGPVTSLLGQRHTSHDGTQATEGIKWDGEWWRVTRREVRAETSGNQPSSNTASQHEEPVSKRYSSLVMAVGTPTTYITTQLRYLGLTLAGLSILIWLAAAFFGGWLCRNALAPLTHMTGSIATITAADLNQRLASLSTGDELEGLSRAFNDLLDRLQVSFDRHRRFAAEASHQLRTPLTAMLGQVGVALRRDRSSDEYRQTLQTVHEQAARLGRIVEMLLFLMREETDAGPNHFDGLELNDWLTNHLRGWHEHPRYNDLRLELQRDSPLWINAHDGLLGEVVDNLLDNACKYSAANSAIFVRSLPAADGTKLIFQDSGCGIPEAELAHIVDPFFRSVDVQRRGIGGSGLGLSIVHRIIGAFGAKLSVESRVGNGSTFTVTFQTGSTNKLQCA
jgi:two-component system OmpR family sensor kinase